MAALTERRKRPRTDTSAEVRRGKRPKKAGKASAFESSGEGSDDSSESDFEFDVDLSSLAELPCDAEIALYRYRDMALAAAAQHRFLPAVTRAQVYVSLPDRTTVDRELASMESAGRVRIFKFGSGVDQHVIALRADLTVYLERLLGSPSIAASPRKTALIHAFDTQVWRGYFHEQITYKDLSSLLAAYPYEESSVRERSPTVAPISSIVSKKSGGDSLAITTTTTTTTTSRDGKRERSSVRVTAQSGETKEPLRDTSDQEEEEPIDIHIPSMSTHPIHKLVVFNSESGGGRSVSGPRATEKLSPSTGPAVSPRLGSDADFSFLTQCGFLVYRGSTAFALSMPTVGGFGAHMTSAQEELLTMVTKARHGELLYEDAARIRFKASALPFEFVLTDLLGRGVLERVYMTRTSFLRKVI